MSEVYLQYTSEYLKGPLYWHPDKLHLDCTRAYCSAMPPAVPFQGRAGFPTTPARQ